MARTARSIVSHPDHPSPRPPAAAGDECGSSIGLRLIYGSAAQVCAYVRLGTVRTRPLSTPHALSLTHTLRSLVSLPHLSCPNLPTRQVMRAKHCSLLSRGYEAAAEVCAYLRLRAVRTRPCMPLHAHSPTHTVLLTVSLPDHPCPDLTPWQVVRVKQHSVLRRVCASAAEACV